MLDSIQIVWRRMCKNNTALGVADVRDNIWEMGVAGE